MCSSDLVPPPPSSGTDGPVSSCDGVTTLRPTRDGDGGGQLGDGSSGSGALRSEMAAEPSGREKAAAAESSCRETAAAAAVSSGRRSRRQRTPPVGRKIGHKSRRIAELGHRERDDADCDLRPVPKRGDDGRDDGLRERVVDVEHAEQPIRRAPNPRRLPLRMLGCSWPSRRRRLSSCSCAPRPHTK